jgi:hypothetical protein
VTFYCKCKKLTVKSLKKRINPPPRSTTLATTQLNNGPKADFIRGVDRVIYIDIFNPMKSCGKAGRAINLKKREHKQND